MIKNYKVSTDSWRKKTVGQLDPELVESEIKQMANISIKMQRTFDPKKNSSAYQSAVDIGLEIKEFQKQVPLVVCLCNPGLKPRHWEQVK